MHPASDEDDHSKTPSARRVRVTRWRSAAFLGLLCAAVSLPLAARDAERCEAERLSRVRARAHRVDEQQAPPALGDVPWTNTRRCASAVSALSRALRAPDRGCESEPLFWRRHLRPDADGVEVEQLDGPIRCRPNASRTSFEQRVSADGNFAQFRCVTRGAEVSSSLVASALYRVDGATWNALRRVRRVRGPGLGFGAAVLFAALLSAFVRRRPDVRDLHRRWREATAAGDDTATLRDGTRVLLPRSAAPMPVGAALLVERGPTVAANHRAVARASDDALWWGDRSALRARVEKTERRRWQLATALAVLACVPSGVLVLESQRDASRDRRATDLASVESTSPAIQKPDTGKGYNCIDACYAESFRRSRGIPSGVFSKSPSWSCELSAALGGCPDGFPEELWGPNPQVRRPEVIITEELE